MRRVNISGIDKIVLLRALWEKQNSALFYTLMDKEAPNFDNEEAKMILKAGKRGYVGYVCGRRIKTHIMQDEVDPTCYDDDFDTGPGSFEKIVQELRNSVKNHD